MASADPTPRFQGSDQGVPRARPGRRGGTVRAVPSPPDAKDITMDLRDSVAVVTGATRGFGRHIAQQLLARGARKVYATARDPQSIDLPGVVPLRLDITAPDSIAAAAAVASDATLLVN